MLISQNMGQSGLATNDQINALSTTKQNILVSGTNIKTVNGESVLGSGNLQVSGGISYTTVVASTTAALDDALLCDTTSAPFTVTLPAGPSIGDRVILADPNGIWGTNNLTVARNGSTIENVAEDLVCDMSDMMLTFVFSGGTWQIFPTTGIPLPADPWSITPDSVSLGYDGAGKVTSMSEFIGNDLRYTTYTYTDYLITESVITFRNLVRTETYTYVKDKLDQITAVVEEAV